MSRNVLLGVTGGIACYKSLDIVSRLKKAGVDVDVIMTENACKLIKPLAFQTLSQNPVVTDTFDTPRTWEVGHISLAQKANLILIAPATANLIGKLANGIADDMLSTTVMASKAPVVLAPAMNVNMYENPIVQDNISKLKRFGYLFIDPEEGILACGDTGKGRLAEAEIITEYILNSLDALAEGRSIREAGEIVPKETIEKMEYSSDYKGKKILVTAGPTVETIDPVRFISNRSSGKMGFAIAEAARKRGAEVTLITGPVNLQCHPDIHRVDVTSTNSMLEAVLANFEKTDIVIKAAAPADYRVAEPKKEKIKKGEKELSISLVKNPDILKTLGKQKGNKVLVGFAAETQNLIEYAKEKIKKKNLDMIVANNVAAPGAGFKHDTNIITVIKEKEGSIKEYPQMTKAEAANVILDEIKNI